ncbi:MAG: 2-amino-4-hydroxy-6-hydroxymethyldihydropteridine diphosphokinase [Legionella sp.]|nr:MAG: 2-amino-4-hydroxy-6-hydroxymethyldihydropteridine diphosphokinase [Legionella sp.]
MAIVYLGLGSNLHSPRRQIARALQYLSKLPRTTLYIQSSMYLSKPIGVRSQPHYINMVVMLKTTLSPQLLLQHCHRIEHQQKRIRKQTWGARTIDIDILLYDQKTIQLPHLQIPHPQLLYRDFVWGPLLDLSPHLCLPNQQLLSACVSQNDRTIVACFS